MEFSNKSFVEELPSRRHEAKGSVDFFGKLLEVNVEGLRQSAPSLSAKWKSSMKPLETKQIVAFVNYFIIRNVQLLQSFVSNVEQKIVDMERRVSRVEVELKLLELKVILVSDTLKLSRRLLSLQQTKVPRASELPEKPYSDNADPFFDKNASGSVESSKTVDSEALVTSNSIETVGKPQDSSSSKGFSAEHNHCPIREVPHYAIYFKMLKMGVPECAVKQKMANQGVDPAILHMTPDALSEFPKDAGITAEEKASTSADDDLNSTSSFSDT
uniref:Uncharacterized protein n=1 Tax=Setaria digitata TaxID=48799 RepID=A0A915PM71_9BILA